MRKIASGIAVLFAALASLGPHAASSAEPSFPDQPIRLIVPFPPGGGGDAVARPLGVFLTIELGQPVVLENVPGASGNIGTGVAVRAPADGYTILLGANTLATNPHLSKLPFDPLTDLRPIARMAIGPLVVAVHPTVQADNLADLVKLSTRPGTRIHYGTPGFATPMHLAGEMLNRSAGSAFTHVPYKGSGAALNDLLGGQIDMMITSLSTVIGHIRAGKLKGIAILSEKRSQQAPDLPTALESGVDVQAAVWYAFFAPAATPDAVIERLEDAFRQGFHNAELVEKLVGAGIDVDFADAEELGDILRADYQRWGTLIRDAKLSTQ